MADASNEHLLCKATSTDTKIERIPGVGKATSTDTKIERIPGVGQSGVGAIPSFIGQEELLAGFDEAELVHLYLACATRRLEGAHPLL